MTSKWRLSWHKEPQHSIPALPCSLSLLSSPWALWVDWTLLLTLSLPDVGICLLLPSLAYKWLGDIHWGIWPQPGTTTMQSWLHGCGWRVAEGTRTRRHLWWGGLLPVQAGPSLPHLSPRSDNPRPASFTGPWGRGNNGWESTLWTALALCQYCYFSYNYDNLPTGLCF